MSALWPGGFVVLRGAANGVYAAGGLDTARVTGSVTVASQNLSRQTLVLHLEGGALRQPKPGAEFDLWVLQKGPRVFGIHEFTGDRMVWLALEDRLLIRDELWGLVGVGVAPFFDYGGAWYAADPVRLGGDVGLSLRIPLRQGVRRQPLGDRGAQGHCVLRRSGRLSRRAPWCTVLAAGMLYASLGRRGGSGGRGARI